SPIESWLCSICVIISWVFTISISLVSSRVVTEVTDIHRTVLRKQHHIEEFHRFLVFKLYAIVSNPDIGYSMLDFFQITRRSTLVLLAWFGSAVVLTLTYFEESGITRLLLSSKKNDLINMAPKPLW
ncbi:hypothetical protein GZH46_02702, partial [Fragariocoptes setiger]